VSFSAAVVSCGAIISNMGKRVKEQGVRSQKGFLPQMNTDFHRWKNGNYLCFICAHLWLQLVFAFGVKQFEGAVVVGCRHEDLGGTAQIAVVKECGINKRLRGGDAVLVEHGDEHLGVDERAGVEKFHGIARRLVATPVCWNACCSSMLVSC